MKKPAQKQVFSSDASHASLQISDGERVIIVLFSLVKIKIYKIRKGKLLISHRYDRLPLLPPGPGGVHRELVV